MARSVVDKLFECSHGLPRDQLRRLRPASITSLRRQAAGTEASASRSRAMELLARARPAGSVAALKGVLLDAAEPIDVRASAAYALTLVGSRGAEAALMACVVGDGDERLAMHAARGLAKIGGRRALDALEQGLRTGSSKARPACRFAASVIAARTDAPGFRLPPHEGELPRLPRRGRVAARVQRLQPTFARVVQELGPEAYGLELDPAHGFGFRCGRRHSVLLFDSGLFGSGRLAERLRRPALLGVQLVEAQVDGSYSATRLLFGWPVADGTQLALTRTDGVRTEIGIYIGDAVAGEILMRSVRDRHGVYSEIRGTLRDGRVTALEVTNAIGDSSAAAPRPLLQVPRGDLAGDGR